MKNKIFILMAFSHGLVALNVNAAENLKPKGCIVSVETGEQYCLPSGKRSDYNLPDWINGKEVYVNAAPGTKVLLSDWGNLSHNRIAEFIGTVESEGLKNQEAWTGEFLDFSQPYSMRVMSSVVPLGCIVSVETEEQYCLPSGKRSDTYLPDWIKGKEVYVNAAPGTKVLLSDWNNLSHNRIAEFTGTVESEGLKNQEAWTGEFLDFSHPSSMRVVSSEEPLGCIVSVETEEQYCLPAGKRSGYNLPDWINGKEVYVNAAPGTKVVLSDWSNLAYNRIAEFTGTVNSAGLKNQEAWNGEFLDFSHPYSMRVEVDK
jgi:hypothetical protein